jgi:hypothetical protein
MLPSVPRPALRAVALSFVLTASACTTYPPNGPILLATADGNVERPERCTPLGSVRGLPLRDRLPRQLAEDAAADGLRMAAERMGANYVRLERFEWSAAGSRGYRGRADGTAYRCQLRKTPTPEQRCTSEDGLSTCVLVWPGGRRGTANEPGTEASK